MRLCLIILALCIPSSSYGQGLVQADKAAHFGVSALVAVTCLKLMKKPKTEERIGVASIVLLSGLAKEFMDSKFDKQDFIADVLGVTYGIGLSYDW